MTISDPVAIVTSIVLMAVTIVVSARAILGIRPLPWARALLIAAVSNVMGKIFVSFLHWPAALSYSLPTVAFLVLSYLFFKPTVPKLIVYWLFGFVLYLAIHLLITNLLGWTFMFPFWAPRLIS